MGGHGLGVAYDHIKAFSLSPFPHQRKICAEGLQGQHALSMFGRTQQTVPIYTHMYMYTLTCILVNILVNISHQ